MYTFQVKHTLDPFGSCDSCRLWLGSSAPRGQAGTSFMQEQSCSEVVAFNKLHAHSDSRCPARVTDPQGNVLTLETFPRPDVGLVITPNPDRIENLPGIGYFQDLPGIGYWRGKYSAAFPDPKDYIDLSISAQDREALIAHLEDGAIVANFYGCSYCRFCGVNVGSSTLTDERYVWPVGLSHYVREHGVWIPNILPLVT